MGDEVVVVVVFGWEAEQTLVSDGDGEITSSGFSKQWSTKC
jgi:hypothetical protein